MADENTGAGANGPEKVSTAGSDSGAGAVGRPAVPAVNWDDSQMKTVYANVVNASSTREEVAVFFGVNDTWNPGEAKEFNVKLLHRIVLNPFAAKRLFVLLAALLKQYETKFGELKIEALDAAFAEAQAKAQGKGGSAPADK